MPKTVSDGAIEIRLKYIHAAPAQEDPANPKYVLIKSVKPERTNTFCVPTDDPRPDEIGLMPEFDVYPILVVAAGGVIRLRSSRSRWLDRKERCLLKTSTEIRPNWRDDFAGPGTGPTRRVATLSGRYSG